MYASIFKVTTRDHKTASRPVFTYKVLPDTGGTVRRPTVSKQWDKG